MMVIGCPNPLQVRMIIHKHPPQNAFSSILGRVRQANVEWLWLRLSAAR